MRGKAHTYGSFRILSCSHNPLAASALKLDTYRCQIFHICRGAPETLRHRNKETKRHSHTEAQGSRGTEIWRHGHRDVFATTFGTNATLLDKKRAKPFAAAQKS